MSDTEKMYVIRDADCFGVWKSGYHIYEEKWVDGTMRFSLILIKGGYLHLKTLKAAKDYILVQLGSTPYRSKGEAEPTPVGA